MLTANNGILIVALTMALGLHTSNKLLIAAAFAMAGLSYLVNVLDDFAFPTFRMPLFWLTVLVGVGTYAYVALWLMR